MDSFEEFLSNKLMENASKQGQISQYEKSLETLARVKSKLSMNGMDTSEIEAQMAQVRDSLGKRLSGTHEWYGHVLRVDQEPIGGVWMWKLSSSDLAFHIPIKDATGVVKIPENWLRMVKPMPKYIEYRQELFGYSVVNLITYTENRTVDIVPFRTGKDGNQYFLIRRTSGLWATVGGHIDEGELSQPLAAARRELQEETGAQPLVIRQLPSGWVREVISDPKHNPSREYNSWTLPFIAVVSPTTQMSPDEEETRGGAWFDVGEMPQGFHFSHHKHILKKAFSYLPTLLKEFGKH